MLRVLRVPFKPSLIVSVRLNLLGISHIMDSLLLLTQLNQLCYCSPGRYHPSLLGVV